MRTSVEPLEKNRFKLTVEVDDEEVARAEAETLKRLAREARIPGFRPGRVPRQLLEARLGAKTIREEALRDVLPRLYGEAVKESALDVIAAPKIDITSGDESGPVAFDAVVEVRPEVSIPGYDGLVVTVPNPAVTEADIDTQVDRLREQFASLTEVGRPATDGDLVTLDVHGTRDGKPAEGLVADDLVYQVGTGGIAKGVDERLAGAKVGDIFEMDAEDAPGGPAHLRLLVKQVREKVLPVPDDEFASDASEFESLAELRADLATRLSVAKRSQANALLRNRALDALSELVTDEMPAALVAREIRGNPRGLRQPPRGEEGLVLGLPRGDRGRTRKPCSASSPSRRRGRCAPISPCGRSSPPRRSRSTSRSSTRRSSTWPDRWAKLPPRCARPSTGTVVLLDYDRSSEGQRP